MSHKEHKKHAPAQVKVLVITVSDTRTLATDKGGAEVAVLLEAAGHRVVGRELVPDDAERIRAVLHEATHRTGAQAVILTGGTGVAPRDVTIEALEPVWDKRLPGFGELFRALSFQEIGAAAWLSRAAAGTVGGRLVFALPGSPAAVALAVSRLILPELGHAVGLALLRQIPPVA